MADSTPDRRVALATIRMEIHGQHRAFSVSAPAGPSRLLDLLPATGEIASQEAQANIDRARSEGREISCRAGCGACCRQLVAISVVEATALGELVARMSPERQAVIRERFADGIRRLEAGGVLDPTEPTGDRYPIVRDLGNLRATLTDLGARYFRLGIACPFLEAESCGIYEHRPAVCREYHVTSPAENCSRLYEIEIDRLEPAFHVSEILGNVAEKAAGVSQSTIMLIQSLEWSAANGHLFDQPLEGRALFGLLMDEIGKLANESSTQPSPS